MRAVAINPWLEEFQWDRRAIYFPVLLLLGFASICLEPRIRLQSTLFLSFAVAALVLTVWLIILIAQSLIRRRALDVVIKVVPAHYVQTCVQLSIYIYWSYYWAWIEHVAPLILGQVLFAYLFDALLSWTRGKPWRVGFGPIPITLSTNLFLCFRDDWFYLQFLVIALAFFAKEYFTWERRGRRTHIFNPSAFPLFVFSIALLGAGATDLTWAQEIAVKLNNPPHIYLWIFAVGLVVQGLFHVTLVTLAAGLALFLANLIYASLTGSYWFLDAGIPIAVFLGMHLLVTDPATSPQNNVGRFIFGFLYGTAVFAIYGILEFFGEPSFYDKLLCVPFLNLLVIGIERLGDQRGRIVQALSASPFKWVMGLSGESQNRLAMAAWVLLFGVMYGLQVVGPQHPGKVVEFWQQSCADQRIGSCERLERIFRNRCIGGDARDCLALADRLGRREGDEAMHRRLVVEGMACEYGDETGCRRTGQLMSARNVALLQDACAGGEGLSCYVVGANKLKGLAGPADVIGARQYFLQACQNRLGLGCSLMGDLYFYGVSVARDTAEGRQYYDQACLLSFAPACLKLSEMYSAMSDGAPDPQLSSWYRYKACAIGLSTACRN